MPLAVFCPEDDAVIHRPDHHPEKPCYPAILEVAIERAYHAGLVYLVKEMIHVERHAIHGPPFHYLFYFSYRLVRSPSGNGRVGGSYKLADQTGLRDYDSSFLNDPIPVVLAYLNLSSLAIHPGQVEHVVP